MIKTLEKIKKHEDRQVLLAKLWSISKSHIEYFEEDGDENDMKSAIMEDYESCKQIINNLYNNQPLDRVADAILKLDTSPREELSHLLKEVANKNLTLIEDNCDSKEDVRQFMVKNGWRYSEECTGSRYFVSFRKNITHDFGELGETTEEFSGSFALSQKDWTFENFCIKTAEVLDNYELKSKVEKI